MAKRKPETSLEDEEPQEKKHKRELEMITMVYKDQKAEIPLGALRFLCRHPDFSADGFKTPLQHGDKYEVDKKAVGYLGSHTLEQFAKIVKDPFRGGVQSMRRGAFTKTCVCVLLDFLDAAPGLSEAVFKNRCPRQFVPTDKSVGDWIALANRFSNAPREQKNHRLELYAFCVGLLSATYKQKDNKKLSKPDEPPEGLSLRLQWDMTQCMSITRRPMKDKGWELHVDQIVEMLLIKKPAVAAVPA
jgi:hypothetical protein